MKNSELNRIRSSEILKLDEELEVGNRERLFFWRNYDEIWGFRKCDLERERERETNTERTLVLQKEAERERVCVRVWHCWIFEGVFVFVGSE